ncbi:uncharacterized protein LOC109818929 [Cajanus cajan]|uniref:uncharacterized protein LOC109818929 n=1 Tax=Cajanus cajan TaxID=3821 RepID=UPI00098D94B1|nr:uncharacterized protein LOC109818929 [Cajanus cajan]
MAGGNGNSNTIPVAPKSLIFLQEWWLVKQRKGLAVGGVASVKRDRESLFLSTLIAEREEANVLHTQDGITLIFRGCINTSRSSQNGVPAEVCQHFLVGFPHDWKKYSVHMDEVYAFGDSSACSKKRDGDALPFSTRDDDFTERHNSISFGNDSNQSESTDNHNTAVFQLQVDMCNGEKGISHIAVESQAEHSKNGQSLMGMYDSNTCIGPSGTKKMKRGRFSGERKENSCSRMVTRSISKKYRTMSEQDEKATVASGISPVRRSPMPNIYR